MGRSPCCDEKDVKKGPWTTEEDEKLVSYIQKHGVGSWKGLPKLAGLNRCGKSCRLRWANYLRPDIKRGKFSEEEKQLIIHLHSVLGNKWSAMATHLPGRTDNEIKNYWNTHIKKKLVQMGIDPVTHRRIPDFNLLANLPDLVAAANLAKLITANPLDSDLQFQLAKIQLLQSLTQALTLHATPNMEAINFLGMGSLQKYYQSNDLLQMERTTLAGFVESSSTQIPFSLSSPEISKLVNDPQFLKVGKELMVSVQENIASANTNPTVSYTLPLISTSPENGSMNISPNSSTWGGLNLDEPDCDFTCLNDILE